MRPADIRKTCAAVRTATIPRSCRMRPMASDSSSDSSREMAMKETVRQTLVETLDYLMALARNGIRPEEARSALRPLQTRHSEVGLELIWDEEAYDQSVHYDALLHLPEMGTVSLSYCDDH